MKINHLKITWSISKGRDTYGYNICKLTSRSGHSYKCNGGGYDMIGTVFGDYLECEHQEALQALVSDLPLEDYGSTPDKVVKGTYHPHYHGLFIKPDGSVYLNGGCGFDAMRRIAEAIGLDVQWEGNKKGHTIGYYITQKEEALA
jgi:hypothetical protein